VPLLEWDAADQATGYTVEVATDDAFTDVVYSASETETSHQVTTPLDPLATYYWRIRGANVCGAGALSAVFSFTTRDIPPILLVDDDDNNPDVRGSYTAALDDLGLFYDVWDTGNSDDEPTAVELAPYDVVVWFTGDEFGGAAGPGATGEMNLGSWLDAGGNCLFLSSQDYHYDRGFTAFMGDRLGVTAVDDDTGQDTATGAGFLAGLGPYTLNYPFTNFSDTLTVGADGQLVLDGDQGPAGVAKEGPGYRTVFFGAPFAAIPTAGDRAQVMDAVLDFCDAGTAFFADGFESGDTTAWSLTVP